MILVIHRRLLANGAATTPHGALSRTDDPAAAPTVVPAQAEGGVLYPEGAAAEYAVTNTVSTDGAVWVPAWSTDNPTPIIAAPGQFIHARLAP